MGFRKFRHNYIRIDVFVNKYPLDKKTEFIKI